MTNLDNGADIRERIDRALTDLSAPEALTEGVLTQGHRLRRRRRALTGAAGVAAAALVAALVVPVLDAGSTGSERGIATQPPASPSPDARTPSPGPDDTGDSLPERPSGWWDMPASTMAEKLATLLPDGMRLTNIQTMNTDRAPEEPRRELAGYLTAVLRPRSGGPGKINVAFYAPSVDQPLPSHETDADGNVTVVGSGPTTTELTTCDPDWIEEPKDCTELREADGDTIGQVLDSTYGGVRSLSVSLRTADDGVVMFNIANTLDAKWPYGATPSADDVPLDLPALRSLAEDPAWTSYVP